MTSYCKPTYLTEDESDIDRVWVQSTTLYHRYMTVLGGASVHVGME